MIYSVARKTAWKLWSDIKDVLYGIGMILIGFTVCIMIAGPIASIIITVCDAAGMHWWPDYKIRVAHAMTVIGPIFWIGIWIVYRVRQSIKELRR